jgi:hypothetical protein
VNAAAATTARQLAAIRASGSLACLPGEHCEFVNQCRTPADQPGSGDVDAGELGVDPAQLGDLRAGQPDAAGAAVRGAR